MRISKSIRNAKYEVGDRVCYRVYPSGEPSTKTVGTVVSVDDGPGAAARASSSGEGPFYYVYWDSVDRDKYPATGYEALDLAHADIGEQLTLF